MGGKCCLHLEHIIISDSEDEEQQQQEKQEEEEREQEEQQEEQQVQRQVERVNDYKEFGRYIAVEHIGGGKCGEVYKCMERFTGKLVVYESHPKIGKNEVFLTTTSLLLESIKTCNPNVARFIGSYRFRSIRGLVFEYKGTDLKKFITISNLSTNPSMIKSFLLQMLLGVAFCHQYDIYHQDLKPENFLVDFDIRQLKLTNFGLVKVSDSYFWYRAPEVLLDVDFERSKVADMWSIGCIFAEMLTNSPLFIAETIRDQLISIFSLLGTPNEETWPGITPYLLNFDVDDTDFKPQNLATKFTMLDAHGVDLLSKMLSLDPKQRITANDAYKHNYFFEPS